MLTFADMGGGGLASADVSKKKNHLAVIATNEIRKSHPFNLSNS